MVQLHQVAFKVANFSYVYMHLHAFTSCWEYFCVCVETSRKLFVAPKEAALFMMWVTLNINEGGFDHFRNLFLTCSKD